MNDVNADFPRTFLAFDVPNYLAALRGLQRPPAPGWRHLRLRQGRAGVESAARATGSAKKPPRSTCRRTCRRRALERRRGRALRQDAHQRAGLGREDPQHHRERPVQLHRRIRGPDADRRRTATTTSCCPRPTSPGVSPTSCSCASGVAKTMARPPVDKLAPTNTTASVSWGEFTQVYGGNVDLKPYSRQAGRPLAGVVLRRELDRQRRHVLQAHREPDHHQLGAGPGHRRAGLPVQRQPADQRRLRQGAWLRSRRAALLAERPGLPRAVHPQLVEELRGRRGAAAGRHRPVGLLGCR